MPLTNDVQRYFDPRLFEWKNGEDEKGAKNEMRIRISHGRIFLSATAAKKFIEHAKPTQEGFYRAEIGIAKKAIAIRPAREDKIGYRFRLQHGNILVCSCKKLTENLEWPLPLKLAAIWDDKHNMLVAKVE